MPFFPRFLLAALLALALFPLAAQEGGGEIPVEPDWIGEDIDLYGRGDKVFSMTFGVLFPTLFLDQDLSPYRGEGFFPGNINLGGTGSLSFFYFLGPRWFAGGEIGGCFASTLGGNMLYLVPMGVRGGYQFLWGKFEFPLSLMVGICPTVSGDMDYLGLFVKPEASAFLRFHRDWSVGINAAWWFVPQWPKNDPARYGNFVEATLSVRYHF